MTGDELYGGRLYALHAFGAQLFKSCDPSFRGATITRKFQYFFISIILILGILFEVLHNILKRRIIYRVGICFIKEGAVLKQK